MLYNVELLMHMKFQKHLITRCRDIDKKHQKCALKMGAFPHLWSPRFFFQKSGTVTFVPLWCINLMQKIRNNLWTISEIFKDGYTDGPTDGPGTNRQGWLLRTPSGEPGVQKCKNRNISLKNRSVVTSDPMIKYFYRYAIFARW